MGLECFVFQKHWLLYGVDWTSVLGTRASGGLSTSVQRILSRLRTRDDGVEFPSENETVFSFT